MLNDKVGSWAISSPLNEHFNLFSSECKKEIVICLLGINKTHITTICPLYYSLGKHVVIYLSFPIILYMCTTPLTVSDS